MGKIIAIIADIFWLVIRFLKRKDDPRNQYEEATKHNAQVVADHDGDALNRDMQRDLDRLQN